MWTEVPLFSVLKILELIHRWEILHYMQRNI